MSAVNSTNQELWPDARPRGPLAVLCSGGVDSAVLLAEALSLYPSVYPLYVRTGAVWEVAELAHLRRFLRAMQSPKLQALTVFEQPIADVYGDHWSITGAGTPDEHSADSAVYLPGRNILLLAKPLIWCHLHHVSEIAMAPLAANPFADATPEFFGAFGGALDIALGEPIRILRPYAHLHKSEVIERARGAPLQHTFSCIHPVSDLHCGRCNKCAERRKGFQLAGIADPTVYARVERL